MDIGQGYDYCWHRTDASCKHISYTRQAERGRWLGVQDKGAGYFFFGDEQGGILLPDGAHLPLGSVLTAMTPHCDPTVNLYDNYYVVKEDRLADIWPIEARGRSA